MRVRARLRPALLAVLLTACSGGYPLPPTPCDDWCDATRGTWDFSCGDYDPAGCVSRCEGQRLSAARCRPFFDSAVACYRQTEVNGQQCYYDPNARPCLQETQLLLSCAGNYLDGSVFE